MANGTIHRTAVIKICRNNFATLVLITIACALGLILRAYVGGAGNYRTPYWAVAIHLGTILPAVPLGAFLLIRQRKGDRLHRILGTIWLSLMFVTAIDSFWVRTISGGIGPVHFLAILTLIAAPRALWQARQGDIIGHRRSVRGLYGAMLLAGVFTLLPGRLIGHLIFS